MKTIVEEPEYREWFSIIESNKHLSESIAARLGTEVISNARAALLEEARQFEQKLSGKQFPISSMNLIIASGHQPVLYHPGLLYKSEMLSRISAETGASGIHIILDTDEGEKVSALYPEQTRKGPVLAEVEVTDKAGLYINQRIQATGGPESIQNVFRDLTGIPVAEVHIRVRAPYEERKYGAVSLSQLLKRPEFWPTLTLPLTEPDRFLSVYNSSLEAHRTAHKIENKANPFPDLVQEGNRIECPYWIVDPGKNRREKLFVILEGDQGRFIMESANLVTLSNTQFKALPAYLPPNLLLSPRGGWVSAFFRLGVSDLFIHGLGGAKYDVFVDQFVKNWLGIELPRFVVASATRYLFPEEQAQYEKANKVKTEYKDIIARTEHYLGTGFFESELEEKLSAFIEKRSSLIGELKTADPARLQVVKKDLNDLKLQIRKAIEESPLSELLQLAETDPEMVKAWCCRTYPVFLFQ